MAITLIESNPTFTKERVGDKTHSLEIAELFCNTIQGEGVNIGMPATFLRLKDCTLDCVWCDTASVWKFGNWYTHNEIFKMFEENDMIDKFRKGQHLVLTGGSPLKQQLSLINFIEKFIDKYRFKPYIEIENEVVLNPSDNLIRLVDCWNNSPKLSNSGMDSSKRLKPELLQKMNELDNSWFKFVVKDEKDWGEIENDFLPYINIESVILMPCGENRQELELTRDNAVSMAIEYNVRFSSRLHIDLYDKKCGV